MIRKSLFLLAAALLAVNTACTGSERAAGDLSRQKAGEENQVELVLYSTAATSEEEVRLKFSDPIEKQFPHVKIKYIRKDKGTNIEELIAAGQTFDLYYESVAFFNTVKTYQLAYDMSGLMKKSNLDLSAFEPTMIDYARAMSGGQAIYGLPVWSQNVVLFYNKDIFDKFGLPYPTNGMTWDELGELAKQLTRTDAGKQYLGFAASPAHMLRANQFSATFLDPKTDQPTINTSDSWKQIYETYYIRPASDPGYKHAMAGLKNKLPYKDPFLKDRNLAMFAYLSDLDWAASGAEGLNWDIAALPVFKELPGIGSSAYPFYWGITEQSKHKDEAMEVIKFLTGKEYQTQQARSGTMTTLNDEGIKRQFGQDSKHKDKNLEAVFFNSYAKLPSKSQYENDAQKAYEEAVHEGALGATDINTLFRKIEETAAKAVDAVKAKK
ncbi:ABC transporter substrate-binding protein [Paenibacillus sp. y28]|uniref:ABC transporter substrate-binding protein n=1 Tax=Paenibacillus sp. y28 TaxID=3129110 RepID=UPI00301A664B